ncbi:MAG: hypothetical protein ACX98W_15350, partial [bacterium]
DASRALTNEQLVLALCGAGVIYLGLAPLAGDDGLAALLREWILVAVEGGRRGEWETAVRLA